MEQIKAIETRYKGYKFRSRLEARWAVFFDAGGIRYEYEPEGFKLSNGLCYLPDFYLPDENIYVEVKPPKSGAWKEILKASKFVGNGIDCLLLLSNIPEYGPHVYYFPVLYFHPVEQDLRVRHVAFTANEDYTGMTFARTYEDPFPRQDEIFCIWEGVSDERNNASCNHILTPRVDTSDDSIEAIVSAEADFVEIAYTKAREARFEHGEKG